LSAAPAALGFLSAITFGGRPSWSLHQWLFLACHFSFIVARR
jgi:hypothetical protein